MKTNIVRIGNSQGIRIPKLLLDQSGLGTEVELDVHKEQIVIRSASKPRKDWAKRFRQISERGDDKLLDREVTAQSSWDEDEWQW